MDPTNEKPDADSGWISKRASGPSRSQRRREALDVLALAETLMNASDGAIARLPLSEALRELVTDSRRITAQIARKRQMQYLAKHLRREEDDALDALRAAFVQDRAQAHRDAARLHWLEALRERLIEEGDAAIGDVIAQHPAIDRNHLRQLVRQARTERERGVTPRAARELFRLLRDADPNTDAEAGDHTGDDADHPEENPLDRNHQAENG